MCAAGDAFWLQPREWKTFLDYEADLNNVIADKPITLLCSYPLSVSKAGDLLDVARAHQVALSKRQNTWEVIRPGDRPGQQPRLTRSMLTHWMRPSGFRCSANACARCLMRSRKGASVRNSLNPSGSAYGRLNYIVLVCWTGLVSAPLRKR
jgi:MEDS: MEthanogen/methylotroph, DcmR Sensory domain